jgi:hypothetical protein
MSVVLAVIVMSALGTTVVVADGPAQVTAEPVYWSYDQPYWDPWTFVPLDDGDGVPVGASTLVRNDSGISATFHTSGLAQGHVVTLWFIVFNNPEACAGGPLECTPADVFAALMAGNTDPQPDFLYAGGHVVGGSGMATIAGHLTVGDASASGMHEMGRPDLAIGLTDARKAQVLLALHSHGPKLGGLDQVAQMSTFLGGCHPDMFQGPGGFAAEPGHIPDEIGECSTMQVSRHSPVD